MAVKTRLVPVPKPFPDNPYLHLFYEALEKEDVEVEHDRGFGPGWLLRHRHDVHAFHFHWLNRYYEKGGFLKSAGGFVALVLQLLVFKLFGFKLVWTVHNLQSHDNPWPALDRLANLGMARWADLIVAHGEVARQLVIREYGCPAEKVLAIWHGNYLESYPPPPPKAEARRALEISPEAFVYLFFGKIRGYKGVDELLDAFSEIHREGDLLLVVGRPEGEQASRLPGRVEGMKGVRTVFGFVPDSQVSAYFAAADVVVLPFRRILTSATQILALTMGRAAICPDEETLVETGRDAMLTYSSGGLARTMDAARKSDLDELGRKALARARELDWQTPAHRFAVALRAVCGHAA